MTAVALLPSILASLPEIIVVTGACILLIAGQFVPKGRDAVLVWSSVAIVLLAALGTFTLSGGAQPAYAGMFVADPFSVFFKSVFYLAIVLTFLLSRNYVDIEGIGGSEYYVLLLLALSGMMIMASATDLLAIYVGLELMVLCTYVLTGFLRREQRSNEAALKYVILGAVSTGIFLYGVSLVYGLTGTTQLDRMAAAVTGDPLDPGLLLAVVFIVAGLVFKIGAVPFHMWVPDVYEGAPTTITAFMSVGPKAAGFAVILRVFLNPLVAGSNVWIILAVIAVVTMALGSFVALVQDNFKRLLAYSSIAHAGFAIFGIVAGGADGVASVMLYLLIYTFMNLGIFGAVIMMRNGNFSGEVIEDYAGFAKLHPGLALLMLLYLFSRGYSANGRLFCQVLRAGRARRAWFCPARRDRSTLERCRRLFLHPHRHGDVHARAGTGVRAGADASGRRRSRRHCRRHGRHRSVSSMVSEARSAVGLRRLSDRICIGLCDGIN